MLEERIRTHIDEAAEPIRLDEVAVDAPRANRRMILPAFALALTAIALAAFVFIPRSDVVESVAPTEANSQDLSEDPTVLQLSPPTGPLDERLEGSTPESMTSSFLAAWQAGDFHTVALAFDDEAFRLISRSIGNLDLAELSRPGWHIDATGLPGEFAQRRSRFLQAELLAAIDRAGASQVDLSHPVASIDPATEPNVVIVSFSDREPVRFTLSNSDAGWRVRRIDEEGSTEPGEVFGMLDPTAGTEWTWCGAGQPVVFAGVDCSRVAPGTAGLNEAEQATIADLRQQSIDDPSLALTLAQTLQELLSGAPGQACLAMQSGSVPVGEAQARAEELAVSTCPESAPLNMLDLDYSAWRYGEFDLTTPELAAQSFIDAWNDARWWDAFLTASAAGQQAFEQDLSNFGPTPLVADPDALENLSITYEFNGFVELYRSVEPALSIGDPTGPIEVIADGTTLQIPTTEGPITVAVEQAPSGRWRVRAVAAGETVDSAGALLQPS